MPRYVALLRGVNVGGSGRMAMADLRACVEAAGYEDVATHIQTGNVLFRTPMRSAEKVARGAGGGGRGRPRLPHRGDDPDGGAAHRRPRRAPVP